MLRYSDALSRSQVCHGLLSNKHGLQLPLDIDDSCIVDTGIFGVPRTSPGEPPTSMSAAIHTFRLRTFWGRIHSSLYSDTTVCSPTTPTFVARIEELRAELENWRASIPPFMPQSREANSLFPSSEWFNLSYQYTILLLYRVQITDSKTGASPDVFLKSLQAAEEMCHGYRRSCLGKSLSYNWGALHELFLSGLTYLYCLWTSPATREAIRPDQVSSTCTDCTIVLVLIAERWPGAAPYRDMFEALARRTMTMMADKHEQQSMSQNVLAYQMRDSQLGGVSQWMAGIADRGVPDEIDRLLMGPFGDWPLQSREVDTETFWGSAGGTNYLPGC